MRSARPLAGSTTATTRAIVGMIAANFFVADIIGGLGPYLSTWLSETAGWNPLMIGTLGMTATVGGIVLSAPLGAVVDKFGRPRAMLCVASLVIVTGTVALLDFRTFWPILLVQSFVVIGGMLLGPALTALTLGVVGKRAFGAQFGWNAAANHGGNMAAAAVTAVLARHIGGIAPFAVLASMAAATIASTVAIPAAAVDNDRARGRGAAAREVVRADRPAPPASVRGLLADRTLILLITAINLFNLGNDQMLPLLGQKFAAEGSGNATTWMAVWILVAQATMIPMGLLAGYFAARGARLLIVLSCAMLCVRALLAATSTGPYWVIVVECLDGLGAGMLSVAAPIAITNLTYGGGLTQTALGVSGTVEGIVAASSAVLAGAAAYQFGWTWTFVAMAVPPALAIPLLLLTMTRKPAAAAVRRFAGAAAD